MSVRAGSSPGEWQRASLELARILLTALRTRVCTANRRRAFKDFTRIRRRFGAGLCIARLALPFRCGLRHRVSRLCDRRSQ
jgi:hypothetical protein